MMPRRRGHSLAECLVAVTLLGSLLGTVTLTVGTMYRADRNLRDALDRQRAWEQFADRFRSDVTGAVGNGKPSGRGAGSAHKLALKTTADQTIHYTLHPRDVERVVRRGEKIVHRETYGLAVGDAGWQLRDAQKPAVVSLRFDGQFRIEAVVRLVAPKREPNDDKSPTRPKL